MFRKHFKDIKVGYRNCKNKIIKICCEFPNISYL